MAKKDGIATALGSISADAAKTLADAIVKRPQQKGAGSSLGVGSFKFPGLDLNIIEQFAESFLRGIGLDKLADANEYLR